MSRQGRAIAARQKAARWLLVAVVSFWGGVWYCHDNVWWRLMHFVLLASTGLDYARWASRSGRASGRRTVVERSKPSSPASGTDEVRREPVDLWVIYSHPLDYPEGYVMRKHEVHHNGVQVATDTAYCCVAVEPLREQLRGMGKVCLGRQPGDDWAILETWI